MIKYLNFNTPGRSKKAGHHIGKQIALSRLDAKSWKIQYFDWTTQGCIFILIILWVSYTLCKLHLLVSNYILDIEAIRLDVIEIDDISWFWIGVVQDCQLTMSSRKTCYFPASFVAASRMPSARVTCVPQIFTGSARETVKCSTFWELYGCAHFRGSMRKHWHWYFYIWYTWHYKKSFIHYIYIHVTRIIYLQRQLLYTWLRYTSSISNFYNFPEQMAHPSKSIAFFESGPECRCAVHRCFRSATSRFTSAMGESLVERQWSLGLTGRSFVGEVR